LSNIWHIQNFVVNIDTVTLDEAICFTLLSVIIFCILVQNTLLWYHKKHGHLNVMSHDMTSQYRITSRHTVISFFYFFLHRIGCAMFFFLLVWKRNVCSFSFSRLEIFIWLFFHLFLQVLLFSKTLWLSLFYGWRGRPYFIMPLLS
jgi:hypothetical protein